MSSSVWTVNRLDDDNDTTSKVFVKTKAYAGNAKTSFKYLHILADTGNRYRFLMSEKAFNAISPLNKIIPPHSPKTVTTAGNEALDVLGRAKKPITLNFFHPDASEKRHIEYSVRPYVVRDLALPAILSAHDLNAMSSKVDMIKHQLEFHMDNEDPLIIPMKALPQSRVKVRNVSTINLKPNHETIVPVKLPEGKHGEMLLEGCEEMMERTGVMVCASLNSPNERGQTFVRIWNPQSHPVRLKSGVTVATASPYSDFPIEDCLACLAANISHVIHNKATGAEELNKEKVPETLEELYQRIFNDLDLNKEDVQLTDEQKDRILQVFIKNRKSLSLGPHDLGLVEGVEFEIDTGDHAPVRDHYRPLPPNLMKSLEEQIKRWLTQGVAYPCKGPWAAALVPVRKKNGGWRFAVDYRRLNNITKKDSRPVANIQDRLARLKGTPEKPMKYYASLDLSDAYHCIPIKKEDQEKTAVTTPLGNFCFNRVNFGMANAPAAFHKIVTMVETRLMEDHPEIASSILMYFDDAVIGAETMDELISKLDVFLKVLGDIGLRVQPKKCSIGVKRLKWLGHDISEDGVRPDKDLVSTMLSWDSPEDIKELASLYGTLSYFRKFIRNFAAKSHAIANLKKSVGPWKKGSKPIPVNWTPECEKELRGILEELTTAPVLAHPDMSESAEPFIVTVDTSSKGVGAILTQRQRETNGEGKEVLIERVIAYASKKLKDGEVHYSSFKLELYGVYRALTTWRYFLLGSPFVIRTDHKALQWFRTLTKNSKAPAQVFRWHAALADYDFTVEYCPATKMKGADGLSRKKYKPGDEGVMSNFLPRREPMWGEDEFDEEMARTTTDDSFWSDVMKRKFTKTTLVSVIRSEKPALAAVTRSKAKVQSQRSDQEDESSDGPNSQDPPVPQAEFVDEKHMWDHIQFQYPASDHDDDDQYLRATEDIDYAAPYAWWLMEMIAHKTKYDKNLCQIIQYTQGKKKWPTTNEEIKRDVEEVWGPTIRRPTKKKAHFSHKDLQTMESQKDLTKLLTDYKNKTATYYVKHYGKPAHRVLMIRRTTQDGGKRHLIMVPETMRECMIQCIHHNDGTFHLGIDRTVAACQNYFYFPYMSGFVGYYTARCRQCLDGKRQVNRYGPGLGQTSSLPKPRLRQFAMDVVQFPKGKYGSQYLLTMLDMATMWIEAFPLKQATARNIGKILEADIFPRYGEGLQFICDQGREFVAKRIQELVEMYKSRVYYGTPYHPNSNAVERHHRSLNSLIRMKLMDTGRPKEDWPDVVPSALYTMRMAPDADSHTSPFQRVFGSTPMTRASTQMGLTPPDLPLNREEVKRRDKHLSNDPYPKITDDDGEVTVESEDDDTITVQHGEETRELVKIAGSVKNSEQNSKTFYAEVAVLTPQNIHQEAAQAKRDIASEKRHERNKKYFDSKKQPRRYKPIVDELLDWHSPLDPESTNSRKLANLWRGPFAVVQTYPHNYTALIQEFDLATMKLVPRTQRRVYLGDTRPTVMLAFQHRPKGEWQAPWMK